MTEFDPVLRALELRNAAEMLTFVITDLDDDDIMHGALKFRDSTGRVLSSICLLLHGIADQLDEGRP